MIRAKGAIPVIFPVIHRKAPAALLSACYRETIGYRTQARGSNRRREAMPSLIRFLVIVGILAGLVYAGLWALANLVEPQPRDMTVTIPQDRFGR